MTALSLRDYTLRVTELVFYREYYKAARKVWPRLIIDNPQTELLFHALATYPRLLVMGHGSASKTFSCAAFFLLKYWFAPQRVSVTLTSATLLSMRPRIWADAKQLISASVIPLGLEPMEGNMIIRVADLPMNDDKHTIGCVAAEGAESQAKIQGRHTAETCLVIEEADNRKSMSAWLAEENLATSGAFQRVALANPIDQTSKFGQRCEPVDGWASVDPDSSFEWEGKQGDHVLRLDGLKSPNIIAGKDTYPFLITNRWFEEIEKTQGRNSVTYWAYGRGWFPPQGVLSAIWPLTVINRALSHRVVFYSDVTNLAACDPAFVEDGDKMPFLLGRLGRQADNPRKPALQAEEWIYLKRRPDQESVYLDLAHQIKDLCILKGVEPENFIMDGTGNAMGLADILKVIWSNKIKIVIFSGACTKSKILAEDSRNASQRFDRLVTELCYASMEWANSGCLGISNSPSDLALQLQSRLATLERNEVKKAESKKEMRSRGFGSPDEYDALNLFVHLARSKERSFLPSPLTYIDKKEMTQRPTNLPKELEDRIFGTRQRKRLGTPTYNTQYVDQAKEPKPN